MQFVDWLGVIDEESNATGAFKLRRELIDAYAGLVATDEATRARMTALLDVHAWPLRHAAANVLFAMPGGPPPEVLPRLQRPFDDMRGEESWPDRLQVAEIFINDRDRELSQEATTTALDALDYATQPWYNLPSSGPAVRKQAAVILGQLEPIYRNDQIFDRLVRVMNEDTDDEVRDAAYGALLRLAAAPEAPVRSG